MPTMMPESNVSEPNVLPVTEVARRKGCTPQAIYNAVDRGDLNGIRFGNNRMVVRDEKLDAFEIQETGGRCHESYQRKHSYSG